MTDARRLDIREALAGEFLDLNPEAAPEAAMDLAHHVTHDASRESIEQLRDALIDVVMLSEVSA